MYVHLRFLLDGSLLEGGQDPIFGCSSVCLLCMPICGFDVICRYNFGFFEIPPTRRLRQSQAGHDYAYWQSLRHPIIIYGGCPRTNFVRWATWAA